MIKSNTVLILGAGASVHLEYPLGAILKNNLCSLRITQHYPDFPSGWEIKDVDSFLLSLSRSGHYSIDEFLESSGQRELGKYLISFILKKKENLDALFPPNPSGWYQNLFSSLIENCGPSIGDNKLSIITFNYDRSLEAFLHHSIKYRFKMNDDNAWECVSRIPIIHVHGILGDYPEVPYGSEFTATELFDISQNIKIIHEFDDNKNTYCNREFEKAHNLLEDSERIVFLGFGFHRDNIRRFNFFTQDNLASRELFSTNSGITAYEHQQTMKRIIDYGFNEKLFPHHGQSCDGLFRNMLTL